MRGTSKLKSMVEILENRQMLSADVSVSGNVLTIRGDATAQNVEIYESNTATLRQTRVSVDANGNGSFTDAGDVNGAVYQGIENIVVRLGLGDDRLTITAADPLDGAVRNYDIRTGAGNDVVRFTNGVGNDIRNSNVALTLDTAGGNDQVAFSLNRISNSTVQANVTTGDGDDLVSVYGGDDVASSAVRINASLGAGNDTALERLDWEGFDLVGSSSVWQTAFHGDDGNDALSVRGELANSRDDVAGTLDLGLFGDNGDDQVSFDLNRVNLLGGTVRVRGNGFAGNDSLALTGSFEGTGTLDAILRGNGGNDTLAVNANGSAGTAILDGGADVDTAMTQGTLAVQKLNIEA